MKLAYFHFIVTIALCIYKIMQTDLGIEDILLLIKPLNYKITKL